MTSHREVTAESLLGPLNEVETKNAPSQLWLSGDEAVFGLGPRVSIVGSRKPSNEGLKRARRLANAFVEQGVVVVSGLAAGIDTTAHEAAIANGGRTVAVLGTPLDQTYPARNRALQQCIMEEHAALSQFPSGSVVRPGNFPKRNRTMALFSEATVIVEAGAQSGTEHQGWEAIRLGRELFILKSLASKAGEYSWIEKLLSYGAHVLSDANLEYVLEALPERHLGEAVAF